MLQELESKKICMDEIWTRWIPPIEGLIKKYYIDGLLDTLENLKIILANAEETHEVHVIFESNAASYEYTDESFCNELIVQLYTTYGHDFYSDWTFFKIDNSSYIKRLSVQSSGISDSLTLTHYCFVAGDSILHILAYEDPLVIRIEKPKTEYRE